MAETTARLRKYEAMIILDSAKAGTDWDGVVGRLRELIEREGSEIESLEKWDERRLAYEVKGHKRGTYVLVHFSAPPGAVTVMRRSFELSEEIVRALILRPIARKKRRFKVREVGERKAAPAGGTDERTEEGASKEAGEASEGDE